VFNEDDYVNPDENFTPLEVESDGCLWAGTLYERKQGGFDLFYDHENSEFEPLSADKITKLRLLCEGSGACFIVSFNERKIGPGLIEAAKRHLLEWAHGQVAI